MAEHGAQSIAVVGAGVAGITAAAVLSRAHRVTLFEREPRLGGHTNTVLIQDGPDRGTAVDTGFIVCNPENYPNFYRFLDQLGVARRDSDMTFGFHCERTGLSYLGPTLRSFMAVPQNLLRPAFLRMILDQRRFNARALADLAANNLGDQTLGSYCAELKVSPFFVNHYLIPLAASIWSSPDADIRAFPAMTFIRFFSNHGMLDFSKLPRWQTVAGGSHSYLKAFEKNFRGELRLGTPVLSLRRDESGVELELPQGARARFDQVVLAAHADQTLGMLSDADPEEARLLGAWRYHKNPTALHTDTALLPGPRRLWASWNYLRPRGEGPRRPVAITYYMNRLQGLKTRDHYLVSLNQSEEIRAARVIYQTDYEHPVYTPEAVASQPGIAARQGRRRTYYCGSYMRYGFHEDAVWSALEVSARFGLSL